MVKYEANSLPKQMLVNVTVNVIEQPQQNESGCKMAVQRSDHPPPILVNWYVNGHVFFAIYFILDILY